MFYLWNAYHYAKLAEGDDADHLTYAHILAMMADVLRYKVPDYNRYDKYILPSAQEYEKAIAAGQRVHDKEYMRVCGERDSLGYVLEHDSAMTAAWLKASGSFIMAHCAKRKIFLSMTASRLILNSFRRNRLC